MEQGDVLTLTLQPDRQTSIEVRAIVWHNRPVKLRGTGKAARRLGLVLSEAPQAFIELLPARKSAPSTPRSEHPAATSPPPEAPKPADLPQPQRYRVRVKHDKSPRTRTIVVFAQDEDDARECSFEETGAGWHILELARA